MGMRIEDIKPKFDVFCLGELLWWMVSGRSKLRLWYVHDDQFELEKMFPDEPDIKWARIILDKCVVERSDQCLSDASALLAEVDRVLLALRHRGQIFADTVQRICPVCGLGRYAKHNMDSDGRVGLMSLGAKSQAKPSPLFQMYICDHCGHAELFFLPNSDAPPPTA